MEIHLLNDIVIIFGLSIGISIICHGLRIPAIVGFLLTGILCGPYGLGLIKAVHEVEILAEIGVMLLLFTIGIEFSFKKLLEIKKSVLMGGLIQVSFTLLAIFTIARYLGQSIGESIFLGFLISLSSTAIVLKLIQERAEVDSPHGRTTLGILIFQDIIIVPMILLTPLLAGATGAWAKTAPFLIAKGMGIIVLVIICAKWIVPWVLYQTARTQNQQLFMLSVVLICLAVAWVTSSLGLSLPLGAFLAGLIISESEYSHHALGNILPFRDVFTSFFFVSIGMLLDVGVLFMQPGIIVLIAMGVLIVKFIIACLATILLGFSLRTSILVGLALGQVGEFSFILSKTGLENGLLGGNIYQMFLASSVLSMAAAPFIIILAPRIADIIIQWPVPKRLLSGFYPVSNIKIEKKKHHLIIIGFGLNGRNLARAAKAAAIPYAIIEINPEIVRREKAKGEPIYYGDSTHETILQYANISEARIVVVATSDPVASRRITKIVGKLNPKVHIIVRTRYLQEMKPLYDLGADEVIPEEFETSIEIFTRVLAKYLIPRDEIEKLIAEVRLDGYEMFRSISDKNSYFSDLKLKLPDMEISALRLAEKSFLVGKTLADVELRKKYGVTVLAIRRNSKNFFNPDVNKKFFAGDTLFVIGKPNKIPEVVALTCSPPKEDSSDLNHTMNRKQRNPNRP